MARKHAIKPLCPTCQKPVRASHPDFPFCGERCRLIDLGKWASGDYVISSPMLDSSDSIPDAPPKRSNED
jgi:uncharacterized protein